MARMVSAGDFMDFLGVDKQRLRVWIRAGMFGDAKRSVGSGHTRYYDLEDLCVAYAVRALLDMMHSRTLGTIEAGEIRKHLVHYIGEYAREGETAPDGWVFAAQGKSGALHVGPAKWTKGAPGEDAFAQIRRFNQPILVMVNLREVVTKARTFMDAHGVEVAE